MMTGNPVLEAGPQGPLRRDEAGLRRFVSDRFVDRQVLGHLWPVRFAAAQQVLGGSQRAVARDREPTRAAGRSGPARARPRTASASNASKSISMVFSPLAIIMLGGATFAYMLLSRDGESTLMEGVQLISLWLLIAVTVLFLYPAAG